MSRRARFAGRRVAWRRPVFVGGDAALRAAFVLVYDDFISTRSFARLRTPAQVHGGADGFARAELERAELGLVRMRVPIAPRAARGKSGSDGNQGLDTRLAPADFVL